jgi:AbiV family abortive infection protein
LILAAGVNYMMKKLAKEGFYKIYAKAHNNAVSLLSEAELLYEHKYYARAYLLAFTGLEEISKSQLAADVYTSFIEEKEFWNKFNKHSQKIRLVGWASEDAERYRDLESDEYLEMTLPDLKNRMKALYVDLEHGLIISPKESISTKDSKSLIHTLRVAIERIMETEFYGERIGSKGFLK